MNNKVQDKIKVLRIIARLNIGGPAIHTILLTSGLDKDRFETVLITGKPEKDEGDMFYLAEEKGVQPIIIPELGRSITWRNDIVSLWKIFCLIKKEKPDIIHTHTAKAGVIGRLAGLLFKFTYVLQPTSYDLKLIHTFHGHVLHGYFDKIKSIWFIWIERLLAMFTDKIIAVSKSVRKELIDSRIAPAEKIISVSLGLELERFLKIDNNGLGNKDYNSIGIIGRLVPIKNHRMFLEVAKRLKDTVGFRHRIKFLIVGDGPLRMELESYAKKLGISEDINFTGWVKDLERIYSELDIVVLTSLNEGTPVALIEAQAAARPGVATKVGGVSDVIEEGRNGFLVASRDVEGFINRLIKLLDNQTLMREMGKYGREKVKDEFNKNRLIREMETLYEQEVYG